MAPHRQSDADPGASSTVLLLLSRISLRHARLAPRQTALLVVLLALGVAVFVSIRLANKAAVAGFSRFTETLTGQSDYTVLSPAGPLDASVLPEMRAALGDRPVHLIPVIEASASRPAEPGESERFGRPAYTLLGVDLISVANLARPQDRGYFEGRMDSRGGSESPRDDGPWSALQGKPRVWLSRDYATKLPEQIDLIVDERIVTVDVAGAIPESPDSPKAPPTLMVLDLAALQSLLNRGARVDRVEILIEAGAGADQVRAETRRILSDLGRDGGRWTVVEPETQRSTTETMTRAFRLNLTILSLIALLVGLYLIFQALDGAVVRRRTEIAILRSLGVTESMLRRAWLAESAVLGLLGGGLGLLLGWAGAQFAVEAVGRTVNALYHATSANHAPLSGEDIGLGLTLGLVASLIAGWVPARTAARTPPAQVMQRSAAASQGTFSRRTQLLAGLGLLGVGVLAAQLPAYPWPGGGRFPIAGYMAALAWILGAGLVWGHTLPLVSRLARRLGRRSFTALLSLSHLRRPSGRHRLAVAALLCAIAMTAGMAILVASFEHTVRGWVERSLQADLYLASAGAQSASAQNRISSAATAALSSHPAVERAMALVVFPIVLEGLPTSLNATDLSQLRVVRRMPWVVAPRSDAVFDRATNHDRVLISESFSERFRRQPGDSLTLPTPSGPKTVTVEGIFADYGNERGSVLADREHVRQWFRTEAVTNLSLFLKPGEDVARVRAELLRNYPGLTVFSNATLRTEILRIFRQTFGITYALEVIGVAVAVGGLGLTLISVLLDRRDELTTLRALGWSHREIARSTAFEGASLSLCAVLGGLLLSLALGWLLIYVINKQSFGWTLGFIVPRGQLAGLALAIIATGTGVSYWAGRWGADLPADREE
ncbi:MAG TPA: FtsX-like permease family protein [Opitutaceae bacterium]|jgi:putative ABC transport system permease protein|nr:FtsX-like permease family protein [Opitutaceae bacterium]